MVLTCWSGPGPESVARHILVKACSAGVRVQGMPDGGEDAFHMRASSHPGISTG